MGFNDLVNGVISLVVKPYKYSSCSTVSLVSSVTASVTQGLYFLVDSPIEVVAEETTLITINLFREIYRMHRADS
ncbi:hypothetical protein CWB85_22395, partial [Pseudoalteromonas sp. S1727]|uniref:hypothetical protein n=1 Tax=Pseudoalteromonas sp. S1727 TaxID=2066514 RepID=UPI00127B4693